MTESRPVSEAVKLKVVPDIFSIPLYETLTLKLSNPEKFKKLEEKAREISRKSFEACKDPSTALECMIQAYIKAREQEDVRKPLSEIRM